MLFEEYLAMVDGNRLDEKLITFGGKAYPKFNNIVILAGGAACFDKDTLVHTESGYEKISEVKEGTLAWTFNEETLEKELKPVLSVVKIEDYPEQILELEFDNGEVVTCTENHEFFVDDNWVKAKDL